MKTPEHLLTDIRPEEVSIVDRPANGEPFFVIKREEGMEEKAVPAPVKRAVLGRLTSVSERVLSLIAWLKSVKTTDEKVSDPVPPEFSSKLAALNEELLSLVQKYPSTQSKEYEHTKSIEEMEAIETALQKATIPTPVRDALIKGLTAVSERLLSIIAKVKDGSVQGEGDLPDTFGDSIKALSMEIDAMLEAYPSPKSGVATTPKCSECKDEEEEKAMDKTTEKAAEPTTPDEEPKEEEPKEETKQEQEEKQEASPALRKDVSSRLKESVAKIMEAAQEMVSALAEDGEEEKEPACTPEEEQQMEGQEKVLEELRKSIDANFSQVKEEVAKLATRLQVTEESIAKFDRARDVPKGNAPDKMVMKSENGDEGELWAGILPPHLRRKA